MAARDPIKHVSVVSTGTVQIRPEHVGPIRKSIYRWLATSRRWTGPRPINAYVVSEQEWQSMQRPLAGPRGFLRSRIELTGPRVNELRRRFSDLTVLAAHDPAAAHRLSTAITTDTARA